MTKVWLIHGAKLALRGADYDCFHINFGPAPLKKINFGSGTDPDPTLQCSTGVYLELELRVVVEWCGVVVCGAWLLLDEPTTSNVGHAFELLYHWTDNQQVILDSKDFAQGYKASANS